MEDKDAYSYYWVSTIMELWSPHKPWHHWRPTGPDYVGPSNKPWDWADEMLERLREDPGLMISLASSIRQSGIKTAVKLSPNWKVVDGNARICAAYLLGPQTVVPAVLTPDLASNAPYAPADFTAEIVMPDRYDMPQAEAEQEEENDAFLGWQTALWESEESWDGSRPIRLNNHKKDDLS